MAVDAANTAFWDELCGSHLARVLGIRDRSLENLAQFDEAYFAMYPYIFPMLQADPISGSRILEVGLGYGSLGQRMAELGADYTGMDIAQGPVAMMNYRLHLHGLPGRALVGSALAMPFPADTFDRVVSIGCFHHTGNIRRCIDETFRVLKPGGTALLMAYNHLSNRHWRSWPLTTFSALIRDVLMDGRAIVPAPARQRASYDSNSAGDAAPETVFLTIRALRRLCAQFDSVSVTKANWNNIYIWKIELASRHRALPLGKWLGLDLYVHARKGES